MTRGADADNVVARLAELRTTRSRYMNAKKPRLKPGPFRFLYQHDREHADGSQYR
jgi:hypothetical protein